MDFFNVLMTLLIVLLLLQIRNDRLLKHYKKAIEFVRKQSFEDQYDMTQDLIKHSYIKDLLDLTKWSYKSYFPELTNKK
jgi:hypothetical protein